MRIIQNGVTFEWDDNKNRINEKKHNIDFKTAAQVFEDKNRVEEYDINHSQDEDRYITIGMVNNELMLISLVYTEREEAIRIISARKATKEERSLYYDNQKNL